MTTRRGNPAKGAPCHQNRVAFKHNKNSKKTINILALPNEGLCPRCHDIIEWKKKYRKYKPLTTPKRCTKCQEKTVKRAYHTICDGCARKTKVCAKCQQSRELVNELKDPGQDEREEREYEEALSLLSERQRRAYFRRKEKGQPVDDILEAASKALKENRDEFDFDMGSDDDDEDGDDDEDDDDDDDGEE